MATYKEISGLNIKTLSSDPSNLNEGDMWYNTTSNTLKVAELAASAWSAAGVLNTARDNFGSARAMVLVQQVYAMGDIRQVLLILKETGTFVNLIMEQHGHQ